MPSLGLPLKKITPMETTTPSKFTLLSVAVLLGLSLLGFFIFKGLKTFSDKDRVVTVKGLAEMNIKASSAEISLSFSFSGDEVKSLLEQAEIKKAAVLAHLQNNGYGEKDTKVDRLDVNDRQRYYESQWRNGEEVQVKVDRYTVTQNFTVKSDQVENTEDQKDQLNVDLISKNLSCRLYTNYVFPELNSVKPQLIAESTKNARIAGEQFANDSQAQLGKIKTASQGQITIAGKYYNEEEMSEKPKEPYLQKARVVSTIVFFLE